MSVSQCTTQAYMSPKKATIYACVLVTFSYPSYDALGQGQGSKDFGSSYSGGAGSKSAAGAGGNSAGKGKAVV